MAMTATLAAFLALVVAAMLFGRHGWYRHAANVLFACTFVILVLQNKNLYKAQAQGRLASQILRKPPMTRQPTFFEGTSMDKIKPYVKYTAKAIYAGGAALIGGVCIALVPDSANVSSVTVIEAWTIAGSVLAAVGGVFKLQNGPKPQASPYPL